MLPIHRYAPDKPSASTTKSSDPVGEGPSGSAHRDRAPANVAPGCSSDETAADTGHRGEEGAASTTSTDSDSDFEAGPAPKKPKRAPPLSQNVLEAVDACEIGPRKASQVLSAYALSVGNKKIDKATAQRALDRSRREKVAKVGASASHCTAVFCDGRNDKVRMGGAGAPSDTLHNISVNMHPGDIFVGHFSCPGRHTGRAVAEQLVEFLARRGIQTETTDKIRFVGGDGTNSVVGYQSGMMAELEKLLGRPLTRIVCLNHHAELPFRALFRVLDGHTTGPFSFSGPIGKMMGGAVHELPIVKFKPLTGVELPQVPAEIERDLSWDLRLLLKCAQCVAAGNGDPVRDCRHGKLNLARWHTAQSRLLRTYMAQTCPSDELVALATYVVAVYVPMIMAVRHRPDIVDAPRHLFDELERQRKHLSGTNLETVQDSLKRNGMMAHPENIVLAMLADGRESVRIEAVRLIKAARERRQPGPVRQFRRPDINVSAKNYTELTDIVAYADTSDIEPPCTMTLDDDELSALVSHPFQTSVPSHTQSTERAVKLTTESSGAVSGADRQDGYSLNKLAHRRRSHGR